uniref:Uncharacterized protein n=1 Tax=Oryza punctata TaxID=4537 RepID=A0A0E0KIF4_ORYPU
MEKEGGVKASAEGEIVAAPTETVACFKKTAGEEGESTFMERVKDYCNQLKENSAEKHWICIKDKFRAAGEYVSQKSSSVFGKKKVEPVVKDAAAPGEANSVTVESQ